MLDYGRDRIHAEKRLLKDVSKTMLAAGVWLTHYGSRGRFDLNFVNSRLLYHHLPMLPSDHPQIDTWRISRDELRLSSNRLNTIQEFLQTKVDKTPIQPEAWIRAMAGDRKAMETIAKHNYNDVLVLEEVYLRLRAIAKNHPNIAMMANKLKDKYCRTCGSHKLQSRGIYYSKRLKYPRWMCTACGAWDRGSTAIKEEK